jgi:ribonuclease P protein component
MTRSTEFSATINQGVRAAQPDLVVHVARPDTNGSGPRIGFVVAKSVGNAVDRHRVARRLRHVARTVLDELDPGDRVVIRALPSSRDAVSPRLQQQLREALKRALRGSGAAR